MQPQTLTLEAFLNELAAKTPAPGGGAAAAVTLALGASLAQMVVRYSIGKKALAAHDALHQEALARLESIAQSAMSLARDDAEAYTRLNDLWKLPQDDERRRAEWTPAVEGAIDPPRRMLAACLDLLENLQRLIGRSSFMLRSDLAVAAAIAEAAARAAAWNVRINLALLEQHDRADDLAAEAEESVRRTAEIAGEIDAACRCATAEVWRESAGD